MWVVFFFQAEDGIRDADVTGVQTCALPISVLEAEEAADLAKEAADLAQKISGGMEDLLDPGPNTSEDPHDDVEGRPEGTGDQVANSLPDALEEVEHGLTSGLDLLPVLHDGDDGKRERTGEDDDEQRPVRPDPVEHRHE